MTTFPRLYVYKASAGSGKTFTLAVQYIRQLIEDPHAYRHILAVTFTNKATAEMKERILSQLYGLATGDAASDGYLNEIRKATGKTDQDIRQAARDALRYIIHDYSRFRIETIDSFFQSVMRNLARELELGANLSIELNNSEVLSEAVDTMIEKLDRRSPVLGWLLEYIEERIDADRRWNVSDEIKGFGRNIFDEEYIERGEGLRKKLEDPAFIPSYRKKLHDLQQEALSQMAGFCGHFNEVLESHGLSAEQLKNGLRGIASYFRKLNDGKLGNDIRNTTVEKCLESGDNWATKTSPYRDAIRQLAESELIPLLEEAELFRSKNNLIVNSCTLALRHLNNLRLLTCPLLLAGAVCCSSGNDGDTPAPGPGPDPSPVTGDVLAYVTSADGNRLFTEEGLDYSKVSMSPYRVTIDPSTTYQTVDGFGPAITGATCYNLLQMSQADRTAILRKCFDPETGAGFSFIRVHIGGSDFSMGEYTCCDREGIEFFAIPAVEKDGIFPVLKEILEINPEIKIMGSPWSCPKWMKGTVADPSKPYDSWTGGRLNPAYYDDYAEYFVQWVTEMEEYGFPIYAITMQNEPLNKGNSMSLYMPWEDQLAFVKKLGPAFRKAGIDTKILCYDHNYNYDNVAGQQNYPLNIYADADAAQWVDGSAWHNYGGSVSELDNIRAAAPDKTIYFTEASIGTWNYNFESCVIDDFESIFLGTLSRYGKGVLLWNLMLDDKGAPNRPGGCTTCYGAIEISSSDYKTLKYNSHYYDLAQCAKVIRPGAVRIGASGYTASGLTYLAFRNPDGSKAFVALNRSAGEQTVAVYENADRSFKYTIPAKSIASFRWGAGAEN